MSPREQRIAELEQLAREEGIALPWPADVIAALEERGRYVDLATGLVGSDDERVRFAVPVLGTVEDGRVCWGGVRLS